MHAFKESEDEDLCHESVVDYGVTIDGSWLISGLSSRHGFVTVMSIDPEELQDVHYKCSICPDCSKWEGCMLIIIIKTMITQCYNVEFSLHKLLTILFLKFYHII